MTDGWSATRLSSASSSRRARRRNTRARRHANADEAERLLTEHVAALQRIAVAARHVAAEVCHPSGRVDPEVAVVEGAVASKRRVRRLNLDAVTGVPLNQVVAQQRARGEGANEDAVVELVVEGRLVVAGIG